ncbi:phage tail sheath C-terminal domain-containing protein [Candidatus Uabimicrobium amorphum]|uniref:Tail protein n=1 Tax=Uabimicrobium amorphum TaxID=2596890 RepID=A0A5S9F6K9_UABAM|nr:phage tail sheath C-terminal domain-containing protein [Candidatus Uabimicrobium amorphum]BBM87995.1 tail protein [Candidatus Uabimicrobium amorphum]
MAYQSPGVYIKEVSSGSKPILSASTSTGAFIGIAEKGPTNKPVLVTNWTQFITTFGNFIPGGRLAYGVYAFFQEGGSSCFVVRVDADDAKAANATMNVGEGDAAASIKITANSKGLWGNRVSLRVSDPLDANKDTHFRLSVMYQENENFTNEYDGNDPREIKENYVDVDLQRLVELANPLEDGEGGSAFIRVEVPEGFNGTGKRLPNGDIKLENGLDGTLLGQDGVKSFTNALKVLDPIDEILLLCIPDRPGDRAVMIAAMSYCQLRQDAFFIADPPRALEPTDVADFKNGTGNYKGEKGLATSYSALYYPWVYITDPATGRKKLVPPSGHIAGIYAYTDNKRGVHKAPAGMGVGSLKTIVGMERNTSKGEQDYLHPRAINVLRSITGAGDCVWGASTLSADPEWKYINIRRLFIMVRVSIARATQWVVFEPNDKLLWGKVKRNVSAYLSNVWRTGALVGDSEDQAFYVKVDEENNPQSSIDAGELHIDIGIAPVKPAEFVIFTITQKSPQS